MRDRSWHCAPLTVALAATLLFVAGPGRCADARVHAPLVFVHPSPYLDLWYGGWPCYIGPCMSYEEFRMWERRLERERERARPPERPSPMGIEAWHAWPGNAMRRMPEGDPANATAEYGESGRVKEEYEDSGEFLPEFLEGRVRPR